MSKKVKKEKEEVRGYSKLNQAEKRKRGSLYLYQAKKREAWKEFKKTPEGIEVLRRRKGAENFAVNAFKKSKYGMKDLRPYKYFNVRGPKK